MKTKSKIVQTFLIEYPLNYKPSKKKKIVTSCIYIKVYTINGPPANIRKVNHNITEISHGFFTYLPLRYSSRFKTRIRYKLSEKNAKSIEIAMTLVAI